MSSEDAKSFVAHMLGLLKGANLNTGSLTINLNFDQATNISNNSGRYDSKGYHRIGWPPKAVV